MALIIATQTILECFHKRDDSTVMHGARNMFSQDTHQHIVLPASPGDDKPKSF